jgi:very-short-patch-repair endonuclease
MWRLLRSRELSGFKFRRQYPCGPFILDFYCDAARLAVELDGGGHAHEERAARDQARTEWISSDNVRVIRFWNHDVLERPDAVLASIWQLLTTESPHPGPLPEGEGDSSLGRA